MFLENFGVLILDQNVATGTTAYQSPTIDTLGCEGFVAIVCMGAAAANNSAKIQDSTDDSSYADVTGLTKTGDGTAKNIALELYHPKNRYAQVTVTRGTTTTIDKIIVIKIGVKLKPIVNLAAQLLTAIGISA